MISSTDYQRKLNMIHSFTSQSNIYGNYCTHYQRPESVSLQLGIYLLVDADKIMLIPRPIQFSGISQCQFLGLIQRFDGIEKND